MSKESLIEDPVAPQTKMATWAGCLSAFMFIILGALLLGNVLAVAKLASPHVSNKVGQPEVTKYFL
jgi:hypothetical protein